MLLPRIFRPPVYQGRSDPENYFEGWYFKLVDPLGAHIWSIIPGISFSEDTHSFIQVIQAKNGNTHYHRFPASSFSYSRKEFLVRIGPNEFSDRKIHLALKNGEMEISGELSFEKVRPFPVKPLAPGIMGWYAFVPFMECYHGVVSMQHDLAGSLQINGSMVDFGGGKGYVEKDWGRSMPSDWIWMQSNHFGSDRGASFMLSVARIPWLKSYFPGFLAFLLINGRVYRFATYNRSKVTSLEVSDREVRVVLENRRYRLEVKALRMDGGVLKAPRHGSMKREIKESIISTLHLELKDRHGNVLFSDAGRFAGLEIVGDMQQYY